MGLYRRKDSPFWWVSIKVGQRRILESTRTTNRKRAELIYARRLTELEERMWTKDYEQGRVRTLKELTEKYRSEYLHRLKRPDRSEIIIRHLLAYFGEETTLEAVGDKIGGYEAYRRSKYPKIAPATIVKELGVLRRLFNIAIKRWRWVRDNPVDRVELPRVNNERVRYLKDEELSLLEKTLPAWLRPIVTLARHTGLRRGNLLGLMWLHINFQTLTILVPETKNGRPIGIPLTETALKVLEERRAAVPASSPYVFCDDKGRPLNPKTVGKVFERVCKKAGISHMRFHDLRHDFASCLIQSGIDLNLVRELLGHRDIRMTLRYAHLAPENLRSAIGALDKREVLRSCYVKQKGLAENRPTP